MPEKLFGLTAKDVKHQRRVNARVMAAQGSEKPHRRRQRQRGKGAPSEPGTKGWYRAVSPILKAITFQSGGSLYRATGYGNVVPYFRPENPPSPPSGLPFGFVYEESTDENDVIRAYSFYSADILPNSIVMCEEIDGTLFVVTEDCV